MKAEINASQAMRENGKAVILFFVSVIVVQVILAFLASYYFQIRFGDGILYTGIVSGYLFFPWFLVSRIRSLWSCGSTLLDCGRPQADRSLVLLAVLLLPAAVLSFFTRAENGMGILMGGILLIIPVTTLITCMSRLQIVENGIWHHATLIKWDEITGYHWTGTANSQLILQSGKGFFKGAGPPLPVPPEQKAAVNELLQKYLPAGN